jgi:transposase
MLAVADRQRGLFDAAWCSELLPEDSIYALLAEHGDRIVRDEDFAECYSERRGRPSIPPSQLAKVLLLAYRDGLSDERAMEALRFDLRWKVALDLPVDHPGFHPTSLVRFRARLLLHGKERLVFERSLELATELGLIEGEAEQIVDSTPMLGAAAVQDTATRRPPRSSPRGFASTTPARARRSRATGRTRPPARRCWPRSQETRSVR